jgi:hypothetical protein
LLLALLPPRRSRCGARRSRCPRPGAEVLRHRRRARYIQKPAFRCKVIAEQVTFGSSRWPFTLARPEALDYSPERFPGTFAGLEQALVLPWNERMTEEHMHFLGDSIIEAVGNLGSA